MACNNSIVPFARNFSSESPIYASAAHAAEIVQGAVPLGITIISWDITKTLRGAICVRRALVYSTIESVIPTTHNLKFLARFTILLLQL